MPIFEGEKVMFKCSLRNLTRLMPLLFFALFSLPSVLAQDATRTLSPDAVTTGVLDSQNVAQVYSFEGSEGETISLAVSSQSGLGLALLVTDSTGVAVAQSFDNTTGTTSLPGFSLPATGTYYVTVFSAIGVTVPTGSQFTLTFGSDLAVTPTLPPPDATAEQTPVVEATVEQTPPPTPVSTTNFAPGELLTSTGISISLTWGSTANLDLEVRDPVGGSLRFATPSVPSGGVFGTNVNSVCDTVVSTSPTEQATWQSGAVPTGSYELIVYYQPIEACPTTEPVTFTIDVTLDDVPLDTIEGVVSPNETYLSSFVVNADGTILAGLSGLYTDTTILPPVPAQELLASAQPLARDVPVVNTITSGNYFQTYSFDGVANEILTITMTATAGSLDTLLLLLDSNGNVIDSNDDIQTGVTNSAISNRRLALDGRYTIVATRYGKNVGGTEGPYELTLTGPTGQLPQEILDLGVERGDIEISLQWNTAADLQLLVRDPRGDSVFDDTPQVPSGGRLGVAGNVNCRAPQASPVSYIYWPQGALAAGLYEVEVWYQNQCNDTQPVNFTLTILVDGTPVFVGTAQPGLDERFLINFVIDVNRQVTAGDFGSIGTSQRLDAGAIDFQAQLESGLPIASGETLGGSLTTDKKYDLYYFDGEAGDIVTVSMETTAGRLDTTLFLIDPNGLQIAENDDAVVGESTNSLINEFTLPETGRYIIIATHFGMLYGGTTGAYNLTFSRLN
jgi:Bacterial pre-peptidase C-terminal domain